MKSLWKEADRNEIAARIGRITPTTPARWGKMTADRMLSHISESLRMATGELPVKSKRLPIRYFPLKQLIIYVLPFPKGTPTAPELLAGAAAPVASLQSELTRQLAHFATLAGNHAWPEHPAFGHLTERAWGVLAYRHMDHHLRQFGV